MPKYKPWLSSTAWEQWESFQQKKEELLLENPKEQIWNIPRLISAAIVAAECRKRTAVGVTLSAETAALLEKQTTKPPQV